MAEESFKERVRLEIIKAAKKYKEIYVDYVYRRDITPGCGAFLFL